MRLLTGKTRMNIRSLLTLLSVLLLSACASGSGTGPATSPDDGMVIIGVRISDMDAKGHVSNGSMFATYVTLKNVSTGTTRRIALESNHSVAELPAGIYCVNAFELDVRYEISYCGQPFFEIKPGVVSNAGYFDFAVDFRDHKFRLSEAAIDGDDLAQSLSSREHAAIKAFNDAHGAVNSP